MKNIISTTILIIANLLVLSCITKNEKRIEKEVSTTEENPKEMLNQAYQLFKEGKDEKSIELANKVLKIGRENKNDTLIGKALTSLCRNAQRNLDTIRLAELSEQLEDLATSSEDQKWLMYRAHMNAEMWRLIGNIDRAEEFYNESMRISFETKSMGMYTIDHFNKSFVSIAKGDFETAKDLIKKYYQLSTEEGEEPKDAYGLIALAYLLEQQGNYKGAHEVATVTRRLFKEQNLFPEPPDEKPLLIVETKAKEALESSLWKEINDNSALESVASLIEKYLGQELN